MRVIEDANQLEWNSSSRLESPFGEAASEAVDPLTKMVGFAPSSEILTPFTEMVDGPAAEAEADRMFAEALAELRDEAFDEAIAYLAEETEQAVADRFTNESPSSAVERERYADAQLSAVRFEAEQYLEALEAGLTGMDVGSLTGEQLDEVLDRLDPQTGELTPAGEEFIGGLVRKAKSAVKFVANTAKGVADVVIGPVLNRLRGLIKPLLRRVLSFAIGRLPTALQPAARTLAARFTSEAGEDESLDEEQMSPTNLTDIEALAESFDVALAEAMVGGPVGESESEAFDDRDSETVVDSRQLEMLAEARGVLIDELRSASDDEDLAPVVEQFVPALLGALRMGINLVGRPKVVRFLAKYLAQLIGQWVGPQSGPLSNAIVDTGLRLISLESESAESGESRGDEAGPVALASVVEDTVRRLAENEEFVFENEDLMQLATAEAFSQAVASYFPAQFVRPALQQAPSLSGTFVPRRPRSIRTFSKYSRTPNVDVTAQIADTLPTFGGSTVGTVLRAAGATFPIQARMHIYQSAAGTTLPRIVRVDRAGAGGGRGYVTSSNVHPLTPPAAGLLLREPQLGVTVPSTYLRSRNRIAVGQRFYVLEPLGAAGELALPSSATTRSAAARLAPSRAWIAVNRQRSRITVGFYLSEAEAQRIVEAIRQGRGGAALLSALVTAYRAMNRSASSPQGRTHIAREDGEDFEDFAARAGRFQPAGFRVLLRRRLRAWLLPALATWARNNGEAFVRAAAHPDPGVTIRVRLTSVPGLDMIGQVPTAPRGGSTATSALSALRGTPTIAISVTSGRPRR